MAHSVSISDGTTTVSLSTSNVLLRQYVPSTPEISATRRQTLGDGSPVDAPTYENVTETIEIMLENSSKTALQAQVRSINRLLTDAHTRQRTKAGTRVYLQVQVDGEASTWRSEIYTGQLELDQDALRHYANIKVQAALIIERAYYFEGPQSELSISANGQSAATGGRTIYNGSNNWVQIAAAQVDGDIPAPALITLTNNTGAAQGYRNIYIGCNAYSDPANFTHIVDGEDAVSGGTTTSNGSSDGGSLRRFTFTSTAGQWTLSGSQLQKTGGRFFRLIARCPTVSTTCYVTPQIRDANGLTTLYTGDEVAITNSTSLVDLGTLPLPPSTASASWGNLRLYLSMRAATSCTLDIDFIQLTPVDSFASFYQLGNQVANGEIITLDGIDGVAYSTDDTYYASANPTVWLYPNKLQRLVVLHDEASGAPAVANTFSARVYYRPRRLTI